MRIIIAGAGDVGFHLAKLLSYEEHDIVLIDTNQIKLTYAANNIDVATLKGNATSYNTLEEANISQAELFISVTQNEETNISAGIIAKHLGAKKIVARIQNTEYLFNRTQLDLKDLGIDEIISTESLAAREIKRLLRKTVLTDTFDFEDGQLSLMGMIIDENSVLANKTLSEAASYNPDLNFLLVALLRDNETIIPRGNNKFIPGDHAYFISQPEGVERVISLAGKHGVDIKNIMILGGSKVGFHAAKSLSKKFNVKLIERDKEKCMELADQLPEVTIINGDGSDVEMLVEENISQMNVFIAVTGNSENNIISCLVAKSNGVGKTICLVENIDYIHISQNIGVDTMINKKLIAANFIFRYIRKGQVLSLAGIHGVDAEVLEFLVKKDARIANMEIKDLHFPKAAIIGGVIRKGKGYTTMGNFKLLENDRVVVLCKSDCIHKVEEFFL